MKQEPDTAWIYVLIDPRDEEIRYVGVTKHDPETRLKGHIKERICQGHRRYWIDKLKRMGFTPRIQTIQKVPFSFRWNAEIYWIAYFRNIGCRLVNDTDGGEGSRGHVPTPETRAKISANAKRQMQDPEQRRRVSEVHKGKTISPEGRRAVSVSTTKRWQKWRENGCITSPETRAKISASKMGENHNSPEHLLVLLEAAKRPKSAEHRAKIGNAHRGTKHTPEHIAKAVESRRKTMQQREIQWLSST